MDEVDTEIVDLLQADARLTQAQIAKKVGLSQPSVADRIRKLEEQRIITGYTARVDPRKLGQGHHRLHRGGHRAPEVLRRVRPEGDGARGSPRVPPGRRPGQLPPEGAHREHRQPRPAPHRGAAHAARRHPDPDHHRPLLGEGRDPRHAPARRARDDHPHGDGGCRAWRPRRCARSSRWPSARTSLSFAGGLPAPELFPARELGQAFEAVLRQSPGAALQYGITEGFLPLRAWVADRLRARGIAATPRER